VLVGDVPAEAQLFADRLERQALEQGEFEL
jgi:hypothetical protein